MEQIKESKQMEHRKKQPPGSALLRENEDNPFCGHASFEDLGMGLKLPSQLSWSDRKKEAVAFPHVNTTKGGTKKEFDYKYASAAPAVASLHSQTKMKAAMAPMPEAKGFIIQNPFRTDEENHTIRDDGWYSPSPREKSPISRSSSRDSGVPSMVGSDDSSSFGGGSDHHQNSFFMNSSAKPRHHYHYLTGAPAGGASRRDPYNQHHQHHHQNLPNYHHHYPHQYYNNNNTEPTPTARQPTLFPNSRRFSPHNDASSYSPPPSDMIKRGQYSNNHHNHHQSATIQIAPGEYRRLRGADETWRAIQVDFFMPQECPCCRTTIFCIQDADFVLCPQCRVIGPVTFADDDDNRGHRASQDGGVGLGFTMDELAKWMANM